MAQLKPLPKLLQKVAIEELGEVPARIPEDLHSLKTWLQQQPHLKARTDDQFLVQFLRGCKFSLEKAKRKLECYYTFKTKVTNFSGTIDLDNPKFRAILNLGCWMSLPTPLNDCGPRLTLCRFNFPPEQSSFENAMLICNAMYSMFMISDPYACINGVVNITDLAQCTFHHLAHITPLDIKTLTTYYLKAVPLRIKALYYINVPTVALKFFEILLPLLPAKQRNRIFICGKDIKSLEEHLPLKYMPRDYGGENGCLQQINNEQIALLEANREYFMEDLKYGIDESLRLGRPTDIEEQLELYGTFRKLQVD